MRWRTAGAGLTLGLLSLSAPAWADGEWAFADWRTDPERAEAFLLAGTVVAAAPVPVGITRPTRLTLEAGGVIADAIFKSVDIYEQKMELEDGTFELNFRDSYKNEIAAYELDKLLGLGLVPPTVARRVDGEIGAMRLWIEGAITEAERKERGIAAPDPLAWNDQVATLRLFLSLTGNSDYKNIRNVLIDRDFMICAIDQSRAFRTQKKLVGETMLRRFSSGLLVELEALDEEVLSKRLGTWLSRVQIKALLKRRDLILRRVDKLVELEGEDLVLFD